MNISNDIKAKVFTQYYNQNIISDGRKYCLTGERIDNIQCGENAKLILKPLTVITDDEAAEVFDLDYPNNSMLKSTKIDRVKIWITDYNLSFIAVQYLQSQGYDLPHYLLGNKTLFETELAIYE